MTTRKGRKVCKKHRLTRRVSEEVRKQQRLRRLGTQRAICTVCAELDSAVLQRHHIAGREHHDDVANVCTNDHKKLTDLQRSHVPPGPRKPVGQLAKSGHYYLGLADLFERMVPTFREFGDWLIALSRQPGAEWRSSSKRK